MLTPPSRRLRLVVTALSLLALVLGVSVAREAWRTLGTPFASLLVDPYGVYSSVYLPSWSDGALPLRHPDQLIACEGKALTGQAAHSGELPARTLQRCLDQVHQSGRTEVRLDFLRNGQERLSLKQRVRLMGLEEWLLLFAVYALVGAFVLWSGLLVLFFAGRRMGALAYALTCVASYVFLLTLFDYHTRGTFAPLFSVAMIGTGVGCVWQGYAFPESPIRWRQLACGATLAYSVVAGGVAASIVLGPLLGLDTLPIRLIANLLFQGALVVAGVAIVARIRGSTGRERAELVSAAWGMATLLILIALGTIFSGTAFYVILPCLIGGVPLSIGYAFIRHNILAATMVLTRWLLVFPLALVGLLGAAFAWAGARHFIAVYGASAVVPLAAGLGTCLGLVLLGKSLAERLFFPAASRFRPTIEQLSDELTALRQREAVCATMEHVVRQWLPTGHVRVLDAEQLEGVPYLPPGARALLQAGDSLWTQEGPWNRHLLVPMRSLGKLCGVLLLAPKLQAALYTSEDLDLLDTVANLGAVALHHIAVLDELEALRRVEVNMTRGERRLALGVLGAELSHEIAYPLNFFRYLLGRGRPGEPLDAQDMEIGREEVERLERMLSSLRRLQLPPPRLQPVNVLSVLQRAVALLRGQVQEKRLALHLDVPATLTLTADPDPLLQLFANLLRNAVQAAREGGAVGVRAASEGREQFLSVWDDGPGIPPELEDAIWNTWVSTKEGGSGLGLAITQRIARGFGWSIDMRREADRTVFCLHIPDSGRASPSSTEPP